MAADKRNYKQLIDTTIEIASKVKYLYTDHLEIFKFEIKFLIYYINNII